MATVKDLLRVHYNVTDKKIFLFLWRTDLNWNYGRYLFWDISRTAKTLTNFKEVYTISEMLILTAYIMQI